MIADALDNVDVQYVWRSLRKQKIDLAGRKSWCESNDSDFATKAADVVGLYMAPPKNAIVLCIDEKPPIQALERAQGYLKLPNGRAYSGIALLNVGTPRQERENRRLDLDWAETHLRLVRGSDPADPNGHFSATCYRRRVSLTKLATRWGGLSQTGYRYRPKLGTSPSLYLAFRIPNSEFGIRNSKSRGAYSSCRCSRRCRSDDGW